MTTGRLHTASYEVRALDPAVVRELRRRDDAGRAPRLVTHEQGGSPLRCCLRLSRPGERVALVAYAPLRRWAASTGADPGAYDEVGPVFVHPEPCLGRSETTIPAAVLGTRRVFRAYDCDGRIVGGRFLEWESHNAIARAQEALAELFADPGVAFVHARAVEFGCFTFEIRRPDQIAAASSTS